MDVYQKNGCHCHFMGYKPNARQRKCQWFRNTTSLASLAHYMMNGLVESAKNPKELGSKNFRVDMSQNI